MVYNGQYILNLSKNDMKKALLFLIFTLMSQVASGHETWLLSEDAVNVLLSQPPPPLFSVWDPIALSIVLILWFIFHIALWVERTWLLNVYRSFYPCLAKLARDFGPVLLRLGLGLILMYASIGGLPRDDMNAAGHPTLFVPDLNLMHLGGWYCCLGKVEIALAIMLFLGLYVRLAALGIIILVIWGFGLFGANMLDYAAHIMGPAILLMYLGAGSSGFVLLPNPFQGILDQYMERICLYKVYRVVLFCVGLTFMYLAISKKLMAPQLLLAILERHHFPTFGVSLEHIVLIMACIELFAGFAIAFGLLVRPLCLFIIGSMTLFAWTLNEPMVIHANIIAMLCMGILFGEGEIIKIGDQKKIWKIKLFQTGYNHRFTLSLPGKQS